MIPYRFYHSERLLPRVNGLWTGCRIATLANGYAFATNGESLRRRDGSPKRRAAVLLRGLKGTGEPDRGGFNQSHVRGACKAMYPDLPVPEMFNTAAFDRVWAKLEAGYVISISVRLSVLPSGSQMRRWTAADHQILIIDERMRKRESQGLIVDPMHPQSAHYRGTWVPKAHIGRAAKAISNGNVLTELFPRGAWTHAERTADQYADRLRKVRADRREYADKADRLAVQVAELTRQLRESEGIGADLEEATRAGREQVLGALEDFINEQRDDAA